ncbi:MAG: hypothetical protein A2Y81_11055 [Nitrospirae bacterium RBG_13_43_8]|nr:MAG: hypothetical protein A2Y81_11055 [Nitrospirae bacterium RBG_13_43_8]
MIRGGLNDSLIMKTPRCRDSGVSLGKLFLILKSPLAPLFQSGVEDTPQQRLWGIEKLSIKWTFVGSANVLVCHARR